ncbi:4'-phosphopantetheinyl transferase superfamily protein [Planctopirus ephydatiae]|uniref:4'-phosphopantetheinyl transferase superfamily protein n=2 Tax=Planctopirus ephydatiae TaxID=2528019 RepID=A0A518GPP4_9PLAN|nr:4'-phosphopantetheinyl transferase superfamily protein [Planctopirus ephydatiae]
MSDNGIREGMTSQFEIHTATKAQLRTGLLSSGLGEKFANGAEMFLDPARKESWELSRFLIASRVFALLKTDRSQDFLSPELSEIEVWTRNDKGRGIPPAVFIENQQIPWTFSLSHAGDNYALAICRQPQFRPGVDLVNTSTFTQAALQMWFTPEERKNLANRDERAAGIIWALKEAVYKSINHGEPFRPRQIEILPEGKKLICRVRGIHVHFDEAVIRFIERDCLLAAVLNKRNSFQNSEEDQFDNKTNSHSINDASHELIMH